MVEVSYLRAPSLASVYTITASNADKYAECPLNYWCTKEQAAGETDPDRFSQGNAVHAALKSVNKLLIAGDPFPTPEVVVERFWNPSMFRDPEREVLARAALPDELEHYRQYLEQEGLTVLSAEQFLVSPARAVTPEGASPEVQVRVKGKIDVMARRAHDNALVILDFKTAFGLPCPEDLASRPSSTIYCCLAQRQYPGAESIVVAQLSVATGISIATPLTKEYLESSRDLIYCMAIALDNAGSMASDAFAATPGEYCTRCLFQDSCPAFLGTQSDDQEFIL